MPKRKNDKTGSHGNSSHYTKPKDDALAEVQRTMDEKRIGRVAAAAIVAPKYGVDASALAF